MGGGGTSRRGLLGAAAGAAGLGLSAPAAAEASASLAAAGAAVRAAHARYRTLDAGANADYLPQLARVDPDQFGIALVTADGQLFEAGNATAEFTIQSISKVVNAALVMAQGGPESLVGTVGVSAAGRVFSSTGAIEQNCGGALNPLLNPGAIATVGNIRGATPEEVWGLILATHSAFAGRRLALNAEVYRADAAISHRNRALGQLLPACQRFPMDPAVATDLYVRGCAITVSARDLARMAATLAFGGRNPVTGRQVIKRELVPGLLAIMATAGLYGSSGRWLVMTGLPGKSGVGGGLLAVAPGRFGIGTFSPRLDSAGNSIRGQCAIADIAAALGGNPLARFG